MRGSQPIVVGVDATRECDAALRWAVNEAALRNRPLHVVASSAPAGRPRLVRAPAVSDQSPDADEALELSGQYAAARLTSARVTTEISTDPPVRALARAAGAAELVVVSAHQHHNGHSVAHAVASHVACPVIVVRPPEAPVRQRVVVGLDGSVESDYALAFAFDEASRREASVEAVHSWRPMGSEASYRRWIARTEQTFQQQLRDSVAPYRTKYPNVPVVERVLQGGPADQLAERSARADLVVVGSRGYGRVIGRLLGSVSQDLLDRAQCPVAVLKNAW
ncbi:MAG: universal stress protein [Nocardioidaceae bacterium]